MGVREFMEQCGLEIPAILEVTARKWEKESKDTLIILAGLGRLGARGLKIRSSRVLNWQAKNSSKSK